MPSTWQTIKMFTALACILVLVGWAAVEIIGIRAVVIEPSAFGIVAATTLCLIALFLLWKLAGWLAFVMWTDW